MRKELLRRRRQAREELIRAMACTTRRAEKRRGRSKAELQAVLHVKVGAIGE